MDRFLTRLTIILVSLYFLISYIIAQFAGIDILRYSYILLFETCVVAFTFCSGKYHCKYIRWTALSILICDLISHTDYYFDYIPVNIFNILLATIMAIGLGTSAILSIRHFYLVSKIKKHRNVRK